MSRYTNTFETNLAPQEIDAVVSKYLQNESFEFINYNGENLWKRGDGLLTAPQYISVSSVDGKLTVQAFLKFPILPAVNVGELSLNGFIAFPIKAKLKERVGLLEYRLQTAAHEKFHAMQQS